VLASDQLEARFDAETGELLSLLNRATGTVLEISVISPLRIEFADDTLEAAACERTLVEATDTQVRTVYRSPRYEVNITHSLDPHRHFLQRRLVLQPLHDEPYLIRRIDLQTLALAPEAATLVPFQHGQCRTYFIRGEQAGFMFGVQVPVLDEEQNDLSRIVLGYPVNYRFLPGEAYEAETLFWGTYLPTGRLAPSVPLKVKECEQSAVPPDYGESAAMLAMVKELIDAQPRAPVVALNGWQINFAEPPNWYVNLHLGPLDEEHTADLELDKRDWLIGRQMLGEFIAQPCSTWVGAHHAVAALTSQDRALPEMPVRTGLYRWAREHGIKLCLWLSMKGAMPWNCGIGQEDNYLPVYRDDRPEWRDQWEAPWGETVVYNCPVNREFMAWFTDVLLDDLRKHPAGEFMQDESDPSPRHHLPCTRAGHDHLPGDASYGFFLARRRLFQRLRQEFPDMVLNAERPQQDAGIWDALYLDSLFTLSEHLDTVLSDQIRTWSRIRHYYHFVPPSMDEVALKNFAQERIDYLMLSVLAVARNYIVCDLPRDWPLEQLTRVRDWLDWGRERPELMMDSVFLPDWPGQGRCDGYVRSTQGSGYAFFFNANDEAAPAELPLDGTAGLLGGLLYRISAETMTAPLEAFQDANEHSARERFAFTMPPHSATLLKVELRQ